jgi:hypothetical protein
VAFFDKPKLAKCIIVTEETRVFKYTGCLNKDKKREGFRYEIWKKSPRKKEIRSACFKVLHDTTSK